MASIRMFFGPSDKGGCRFQRAHIGVSSSLINALPAGCAALHLDVNVDGTPRIDPESSNSTHLVGTLRCSPHNEQRRFAVKLVAHIDLQPRSAQYEVAQKLKEEAKFYVLHLFKFQGTIVPVHYGLWTAKTQWGGLVACEIMEWCGEPLGSFELGLGSQGVELRLQLGRSLQALHDADIEHRQLEHEHELLDHLLYDESSGTVRIVDFAQASYRHVCERRLPLKAYKSCPSYETFGCSELVSVGIALFLFGDTPEKDDMEVRRAIKVYERHRALGYPHPLALEAQDQFVNRTTK